MSFQIAEAFVSIIAKTDKLSLQVKGAVRKVESDVGPDAEKAGSGIGAKFISGFLSQVRSPTTLKTFLGTFAGITAGALTAVPALQAAGKWVLELGRNAGAASPALVGMGVVGAAAAATLKLGFSGFGTALKQGNTPAEMKKINEALAALHPEARATAYAVRSMHPEFETLKRSVQGRIFKGLADDVKAVGEQLIAKATPGMERFSGVVNLVLQDLLSWGGSLAGVRATEQVTNAMYIGMARLHPSISRVTSSFGNMIGRIAEVSTAAGASGLGGVLDWLADRMDRVTAATVSEGLANLNTKFHQVKDTVSAVIERVKQGWEFWQTYRTEIGYVQDALAILAIAFGGPVVAAGAAVLLIMRHWDELKAAWQSVVEYFTNTPAGQQAMEALRNASQITTDGLLRNWQTVKDAVGPVLEEIHGKIVDKLIPAFAEFLEAVAPVAQWFRDTLAPIVSEEMNGVLNVISGVLDIITGIFQVFTGLLTGDWSKMWEGIKNIASGAWQILKELFKAVGGQIVIDMFNKGQQLWRDFTGWVGRLRDDTSAYVHDLRVRAISALVGLVHDGLNKARELKDGFLGWVGRLRDDTAGFVGDMRNRVVGHLDSLRDGFWRTVDRIGEGWNRLREIVASPIRAVFSVWNRANDLWGGADIHLATGGRVPGSGSQDTVAAMLTPGEFVVRKGIAEPTRRFLEALNAGQPEAVQAAGGRFGRMQYFAEGGPVANAIRVARSMHGKPYVWGGSGTGGTDCSGFMAYITRALRMEANPYRRIGTTHNFPWPGFVPGLSSAFAIGNVPSSHMRGTLAGMNVESGGGHGYVAAGPPARGVPYGSNYSLPQAGGQFVGGGDGPISMKPMVKKIIHDFMNPLINRLPSPPPGYMEMPRGMATKARDFLTEKAMSLVPFDQGGMLQPGMQYVRNDTSRPERVLSPDQTRAFERLVDWLDRQSGSRGPQPVNVHVTQTSGSPAETGRMVALALRAG